MLPTCCIRCPCCSLAGFGGQGRWRRRGPDLAGAPAVWRRGAGAAARAHACGGRRPARAERLGRPTHPAGHAHQPSGGACGDSTATGCAGTGRGWVGRAVPPIAAPQTAQAAAARLPACQQRCLSAGAVARQLVAGCCAHRELCRRTAQAPSPPLLPPDCRVTFSASSRACERRRAVAGEGGAAVGRRGAAWRRTLTAGRFCRVAWAQAGCIKLGFPLDFGCHAPSMCKCHVLMRFGTLLFSEALPSSAPLCFPLSRARAVGVPRRATRALPVTARRQSGVSGFFSHASSPERVQCLSTSKTQGKQLSCHAKTAVANTPALNALPPGRGAQLLCTS